MRKCQPHLVILKVLVTEPCHAHHVQAKAVTQFDTLVQVAEVRVVLPVDLRNEANVFLVDQLGDGGRTRG